MNPVQTKQRIEFYIDLTSAARFTFAQYAIAVNDSVIEFINEEMGDEENRNPENFQWIQRIRDNLYTLIKTSAPTVTPGTAVTNRYYTSLPSTFPYPADYDTFIYLSCIIDGYTVYARPTTYNLIGPLLENSFKRPTNQKIYFNDNGAGTGATIWRANTGTFTSASLVYLRFPTDFSLSGESNVISTGGTLTNAVTYYALEVSVYALITYQIGDTITGTGAALTSGSVIRVSLTSPIDLPATVHEVICKRAATKLLATIQQFDQSMAIENEVQKG